MAKHATADLGIRNRETANRRARDNMPPARACLEPAPVFIASTVRLPAASSAMSFSKFVLLQANRRTSRPIFWAPVDRARGADLIDRIQPHVARIDPAARACTPAKGIRKRGKSILAGILPLSLAEIQRRSRSDGFARFIECWRQPLGIVIEPRCICAAADRRITGLFLVCLFTFRERKLTLNREQCRGAGLTANPCNLCEFNRLDEGPPGCLRCQESPRCHHYGSQADNDDVRVGRDRPRRGVDQGERAANAAASPNVRGKTAVPLGLEKLKVQKGQKTPAKKRWPKIPVFTVT